MIKGVPSGIQQLNIIGEPCIRRVTDEFMNAGVLDVRIDNARSRRAAIVASLKHVDATVPPIVDANKDIVGENGPRRSKAIDA